MSLTDSSNCKPELLDFNGGYNCTGTQTSFSCVVYCPVGIDFEFEPAPLYNCDYASSTFDPSPTPNCIFGSGVQVNVTLKGISSFFRSLPLRNRR